MRFISRYGRFGVCIRPMVQEAYATGMAKVVQEPIYAMFEPWQLLPHERELALNHWTWNGSVQSEDEVTTLPPDNRIGLYDSIIDQQGKGWSDELRAEVERALILNAELTDNILVVPATVLTPPWPRYDEFRGSPRELVERLIEDGHDLADVLTYEKEGPQREEFIAELEGLIDDPDALLELQPVAEEILG